MNAFYHHVQQPPLIILSKICNTCHTEKLLDAFPPQKERVDGYRNECKDCRAAYMRARRTRLNPKHIVQSTFFRVCSQCHTEKFFDQFPAAHGRYLYGIQGVCRECQNAHDREYYASNPQRDAIYKSKARKRDPERFRLQSGRYHAKNRAKIIARRKAKPLLIREGNARYSARKKAATIDKVGYKRILERDGYWCHICYQEIDRWAHRTSPRSLHFDHVIPLTRGGAHSESNIKPSHKVCNLRKRNKLMEELIPFDRRGPALQSFVNKVS